MASLIEADQTWNMYKNMNDEEIRNGLTEFGSINGYNNTIDLLDATTNLMEIIEERIRYENNTKNEIGPACADMIIQLV